MPPSLRFSRPAVAAGCLAITLTVASLSLWALLRPSKPCPTPLNPNHHHHPQPSPLPHPPTPTPPHPYPPFIQTLLQQPPPRLPHIVQRFQAGALTEDQWPLDPDNRPITSETGSWWTGAVFKARDFGALTEYTACTQLQMKCALHASRSACLGDGFCAWCSDRLVCLDRHLLGLAGPNAADFCAAANTELAPLPAGRPSLVHLISGGQARSFNGSDIPGGGGLAELQQLGCTTVVHGRFEMPLLQNEGMFFHWLFDLWPTLALQGDRLVHYVLANVSTDMLSYLGLLSDNCWRLQRSLPPGTCLATWPSTPARPPPDGTGGSAYELVRRRMSPAPPPPPPPRRPLVTIIQRRAKRFLLNADTELLPATRALGADAVVADLDDLTLHEQLQLLSVTTVLVGLHGSGLANFVYLPRGAGVLEVYQHKSGGYAHMYYLPRVKFAGMNYVYKAIEVLDPSDHVFHWQHYKSDVSSAEERQAMIAAGPKTAADFFTFWVNTDTRLQVHEYLPALKELINTAPIHAEMGFSV